MKSRQHSASRDFSVSSFFHPFPISLSFGSHWGSLREDFFLFLQRTKKMRLKKEYDALQDPLLSSFFDLQSRRRLLDEMNFTTVLEVDPQQDDRRHVQSRCTSTTLRDDSRPGTNHMNRSFDNKSFFLSTIGSRYSGPASFRALSSTGRRTTATSPAQPLPVAASVAERTAALTVDRAMRDWDRKLEQQARRSEDDHFRIQQRLAMCRTELQTEEDRLRRRYASRISRREVREQFPQLKRQSTLAHLKTEDSMYANQSTFRRK